MYKNFDDFSLHNRFESLALLLSDASGECADSDSEDDDVRSDTTCGSQQSPRRRQGRTRNRTRPSNVPPQPPEYRSASEASQQKSRTNYVHACRRIQDKISKLSDIDVALYKYSHNLEDGELDLFVDVVKYLTKDIDHLTVTLLVLINGWRDASSKMNHVKSR